MRPPLNLIGKLVIFHDASGDVPALIQGVVDETRVNLTVFQPAGAVRAVSNAVQGPASGQWDWTIPEMQTPANRERLV